jgi:hypothetical protein
MEMPARIGKLGGCGVTFQLSSVFAVVRINC